MVEQRLQNVGYREKLLLFQNTGKGWKNVSAQSGSIFERALAGRGMAVGDFDNDGWLDMYLGTGAPGYEFLVPNRMFKNVGGQRFADITATNSTFAGNSAGSSGGALFAAEGIVTARYATLVDDTAGSGADVENAPEDGEDERVD